MPEFFNVLAPNIALRTLLDHLPTRMETETVLTPQALGRVTAAAIVCPRRSAGLSALNHGRVCRPCP